VEAPRMATPLALKNGESVEDWLMFLRLFRLDTRNYIKRYGRRSTESWA